MTEQEQILAAMRMAVSWLAEANFFEEASNARVHKLPNGQKLPSGIAYEAKAETLRTCAKRLLQEMKIPESLAKVTVAGTDTAKQLREMGVNIG